MSTGHIGHGRTTIANARVHTPAGVLDRGWVSFSGRRIDGLGRGAPGPGRGAVVDAGGADLLPGFVDLHVHGALGHDTMDADPEGLRAMARFLARHGVTSFLPTTWAAPGGAILAALEAVAVAAGPVPGGATILGAHLEGPYLNPARCGAQDPGAVRPPDLAEARRLLDTGVVRILALAPEVTGALPLVAECRRRGVVASAGHTEATFEEMEAAVDAGVRHVTHLFNAMSGFSHKAPGAAGAALALPALCCEVIADGVHVHPAALRVAWRAKGPRGIVLVSDATRAAGLADGEVDLGGRRGYAGGGVVRLGDGTLAGSALSLDEGLRRFLAATGARLEEAWPTVSANAAAAVGRSAVTGSIEPGKAADLVLLDGEGRVLRTVAEGRTVHVGPARAGS